MKTQKRIISILLLIAAVVLYIFPAKTHAADSVEKQITIGDWVFFYTMNESVEAKITGCKYNGAVNCRLVLPSRIDGCPVVEISDDSYRVDYAHEFVTELILPEQLKTIGNLYNYTNLAEIKVPASVSYIAPGAFHGFRALQKIEVSEKNTKYDSRNACNAIIEKATNELVAGCKNTEIPSSVAALGDSAFWGSGLEKITVPSSVKKIGSSTFRNCENLKEVNLYQGVETVGSGAFNYCTSLEEIYIPISVTFIYNEAFDVECTLLCDKENTYVQDYAKGNGYLYEIVAGIPIQPTAAPMPTVRPTNVPDVIPTVRPTPVPTVKKQSQWILASSFVKPYGSKKFWIDAKTSGDGRISYQVSNKKVAVVSQDGEVSVKGYGRTTVTITASATSHYLSAVKDITVTVVPQKASIRNLTSKKKGQIVCKVKKQKGVTGYEYLYTAPSGAKKILKTKKTSLTTIYVSKVKYRVKVRAYKKIGKKLYKGAYSKQKTIKTK